jgi:phosphohistidine phosphatase SixA
MPNPLRGLKALATTRAITATWAVAALLIEPSVWAQSKPPTDVATPTPTAPEFQEIKATPALLPLLRKGGYVLYMRHGNTNNDIPDQPKLDLADCSTQRPLNAEGRAVAKQVGQAIQRARIPVGEVHASPLCRARETARIAFGSRAKTDPLLMYTAHLTAAQKQPVLAHTRSLLSAPVAAGTNRVLVAHAPNMADLMGYFVKPEGTVVVIQPQGGGRFTYVASIPPDLWPHLAR